MMRGKVTDIGKPVTFDESAVRKFCDFLDPLSDCHCFLTITDEKERFKDKEDPNNKVFRQLSDGTVSALRQLNVVHRAGVYVVINQLLTTSHGARTERPTAGNIDKVRFLFLDYDAKDNPNDPLDQVVEELSPDCIVRSSLKNWHAYIRINGVSLEQFKILQKALAERYGTDPSVNNLNRYMRVPGTFNMKNPEAPYMVTASYTDNGLKTRKLADFFDLDFVTDAIAKAEQAEERIRDDAAKEFSVPFVEAMIERMISDVRDGTLEYVNGESEGRKPWLNIGMALHHWDDDPDGPGFELWRRISIEGFGDEYDTNEGENERLKVWESITDSDRPITLNSFNKYFDSHTSAVEDFKDVKVTRKPKSEKAPVHERSRAKVREVSLEEMRMTPEKQAFFDSMIPIIPGVLKQGMALVIAAESNSGKTGALMEMLSRPGVAARGFAVHYLHPDSVADGAHIGVVHEKLCPPKAFNYYPYNLTTDYSGKEVLSMLERMSVEEDISRCIFVLDSMPSFITGDPGKDETYHRLFIVINKLKSRGASVVILVHCLKYRGEDGLPTFKGSGIIKDLCDGMCVLMKTDEAQEGEGVELSPQMEQEYKRRQKTYDEMVLAAGEQAYQVPRKAHILSIVSVLKLRSEADTDQSWLIAFGFALKLETYVKVNAANDRVARDKRDKREMIDEFGVEVVMREIIQYHDKHKHGIKQSELILGMKATFGATEHDVRKILEEGMGDMWEVGKRVQGDKHVKRLVPMDGKIIHGGKALGGGKATVEDDEA